jgi:conjugative transfer region protein TrbK
MTHSIALSTFAIAIAVAVSACSHHDDESKAALAKDPERLRMVLRACRDDPSRSGDARCRAASDAWRERFFQRNDGKDVDGGPAPSVQDSVSSSKP